MGEYGHVITVVTDQLPYPPRNGVTLPVHEFISVFGPKRVQLVLLRERDSNLDPDQLAHNEARFGKVTVIEYCRAPALHRAISELRGCGVFCHGWTPMNQVPDLQLDRLLVSPMSAVAKWNALRVGKPAGSKWIAGINDCMTAEFRFRSRQFSSGFASRIKAWCDFARSHNIGRIERSLLRDFDRILVQTHTDKVFAGELVGECVKKRTHIVPNGVSADYLRVPLERTNATVVTFVADFSDEYHATAMWLLQRVWPAVHSAAPHLELQLIGKGGRSALVAAVHREACVSYIPYVQDLAGHYAQTAISLSPVFKGFGLINKTVEAMAAGLPVVGGAGAFNGIGGFEDGRHGVVVKSHGDAGAFANAILLLANDHSLRQRIGCSARDIISRGFDWGASGRAVAGMLG